MDIQGYQVSELIHQGVSTSIYRGIRESDRLSVIFKVLNLDYPSLKELSLLKQEYELLQKLHFPGIIQCHALEKYSNGLVLVLEDIQSQSLQKWIKNHLIHLSEFFQIAIPVVEAVGQIHLSHIIHKDLNPANILYNPNSHEIKIIDFGISSQLSQENHSLKPTNILEGTLAYVSPEQTGRMNRVIDWRTDFYSLGVTFYEMLTGQLPFTTEDPLEMVHCHIAKNPIPPHQINKNIPEMISQIIMKLLSKVGENRYQNAQGIKFDLAQCESEWNENHRITPFTLGQKDISDRFNMPQKLYGRASDVALMFEAFHRICEGKSEIMLVTGHSGVGKSSLVKEVSKPIEKQRVFFISGKFDPFKKNIPYSSIIQALQELIQLLLTESEKNAATWKKKIIEACAPNLQILIDVIPELALIVGKQTPVQQLPPAESRNRFNLVFRSFVKVFSTQEHPLVLFLDDLQWADLASLELIQRLMCDSETNYLFLIGAYRDNEVDEAHPLRMQLEEIEKKGVTVNRIHVTPLTESHVSQLISETLRRSEDQVSILAELVFRKTRGTPFFVNHFLESLYDEKLLYFDQELWQWNWTIEKIKQVEITNNVVDLLVNKIQKLKTETQNILKLAACVGTQFDLQTLALITECSRETTAHQLWNTIEEGLIVPVGEGYKLYQGKSIDHLMEGESSVSSPAEERVYYRFSHDKVLQAAYSLIPEEQKAMVHLKVGRYLLKETDPTEFDSKLFDIVNQLNIGMALIQNDAERDALVHLNLLAGKKAKESTAFGSAIKHFSVGIELLPPNKWEENYDLTRTLYMEKTECLGINREFEEAEINFDLILTQVKTNLEKAQVYNIKAALYSSLTKFHEAISCGEKGLHYLGIHLPKKLPQIATVSQLLTSKWYLRNHQHYDSLLEHKLMHDPAMTIAIELLMNLSAPTFFVNQNLMIWVAVKMMNLSLKYGNTKQSSFAYMTYGVILGPALGDYKAGYDFGTMALKLDEKFNNLETRCKNQQVFGSMLSHWITHLNAQKEYCTLAYNSALEAGNIAYAVYAIQLRLVASLLKGDNLEHCQNKVEQYFTFVRNTEDWGAVSQMRNMLQTAKCLRGQTKGLGDWDSEAFNAKEHLEKLDALEILTPYQWYYCFRAWCFYLAEDYQQVLSLMRHSQKAVLEASLGLITYSEQFFYHSLAITALYEEVSNKEQKPLLRVLNKNCKKMHQWALCAQENILPKYLLVEAEAARIFGQEVSAMEKYDEAIALARKHDFMHLVALGNELAAKFYHSKNRKIVARTYLLQALYAYETWGALAKVKLLEQRYPELLAQRGTSETGTRGLKTMVTTMMGATTEAGDVLDLMTIMKASQALSSEIVLGKLLEKLLNFSIENAGAQKGALILEKEGKWRVEAEIQADQNLILLQSISVDECERVSPAIIHYVLKTQEHVVLNDATQEGRFVNDVYILHHQTKSVLCMPIIHQGKLLGVLYLENNLMTGTFTPDRLETLTILSSQAAISIENANLYANLAGSIRREEELKTAAAVQKALLPKHLPQVENLNLAAYFESASETGGDWYGFMSKLHDTLIILIGDVTGHGTPAALVTATASATARMLEKMYAFEGNRRKITPSVILSHLNHAVFEAGAPNYLMTFFVASIQLSNGLMTFANAGHVFPELIRKNRTEKRLLASGKRLGCQESSIYEDNTIQLEEGDLLFFYTDGLTENLNPEGKEWGSRNLTQFLKSNHDASAQEIINQLNLEVKRFNQGTPIEDDITMVVCQVSKPFQHLV
ncbi:AAA family ATPase [Deltaproteobacteria bacterium TL4]